MVRWCREVAGALYLNLYHDVALTPGGARQPPETAVGHQPPGGNGRLCHCLEHSAMRELGAGPGPSAAPPFGLCFGLTRNPPTLHPLIGAAPPLKWNGRAVTSRAKGSYRDDPMWPKVALLLADGAHE